MSILSDRLIHLRCLPVACYSHTGTTATPLVLSPDTDALVDQNTGNTVFHASPGYGSTAAAEVVMTMRDTKETKKFPIREGIAVYEQTVIPAGAFEQSPPMIEPFVSEQVRTHGDKKIISYGLSSFGYDLRLGTKIKIFTNVSSVHSDPKDFDSLAFVEKEYEVGERVIIPPNSFILGHSLECIAMPDDIVGVVTGKSTIARIGVNCLCTPLEPGWEGYVTLEFANGTPLPAVLYAGEGCCQVMFHQGARPRVTYRDRGGKYQHQACEPVTPKV